jgi:hypothetical protein
VTESSNKTTLIEEADGPPRDAVPDWVKQMHLHHAQHGTYRAIDIARVLGDQRTSFQSQSNLLEHVANWFAVGKR